MSDATETYDIDGVTHAANCHAVLGQDLCHCGDYIDAHSLYSNHSPVGYDCTCGADALARGATR